MYIFNLHIQFTIRNAKRQLYYDNHGDENRVFDFRVAATQQLIVSIVIPESKKEETEPPNVDLEIGVTQSEQNIECPE